MVGCLGPAALLLIVLLMDVELFDVFSCAVAVGLCPAKTLAAAALDDAVVSIYRDGTTRPSKQVRTLNDL